MHEDDGITFLPNPVRHVTLSRERVGSSISSFLANPSVNACKSVYPGDQRQPQPVRSRWFML